MVAVFVVMKSNLETQEPGGSNPCHPVITTCIQKENGFYLH